MNASVSQAKSRLGSLIRAVERGETVVITRRGKPVAQLASVTGVVLGGMRDRIKLLPDWDDPIDLDEFLDGQPFVDRYEAHWSTTS